MKENKGSWHKVLREYFIDHNLLHYASSLSFHTILALIPVLLISFYFFTKLPYFSDYYDQIKTFVFSSIIPTQQQFVSQNIDTFMHNTEKLGLLGVLFVLYVSVMFFDDFEYVVNKIFHVPPRKFLHSISIYLTMTILIPIGLAFSFYLSLKANVLLHSYRYTSDINILTLTSYLIIWMLYFLAYFISVNTKVRPKSALIGSFAASLVWFASKMLFVYYITYNKTYTTIYGSFSIIMFFFIWIYLSWIIFLYGVKLCYYLNRASDEQKREQRRQTKQSAPPDRSDRDQQIDSQKP